MNMKERLIPGEVQMARFEAGLSQKEAYERSGVTEETISDIERGRRVPHPSTLKKLADAYGVPITRFLRSTAPGEEQVPKAPAPPSQPRAPEDSGEESEEERRERLRDIRELMERALRRLEDMFEESKGKDGRKLVDTCVLTVVATLGWQQFTDKEVGEPRDSVHDRAAIRVYSTLAKYDDLIDDLVESALSAPEAEAEVISLLERLQRREAG